MEYQELAKDILVTLTLMLDKGGDVFGRDWRRYEDALIGLLMEKTLAATDES